MARRTTPVDWSSIERLYRDGMLSIRAIADQHEVTEGAIRKEAKRQGWVRSDASRVQQLARQIAAESALPTYSEPGEDRVQALANVGAAILTAHQNRFARLQRIVDKQVEELEAMGDTLPILEGRIEEYFLLKAADDPATAGIHKMQMQRALHAVRLPSRAKVLVDIVGAASKLAGEERRAFNLDETGDNRSYEDLLAEINAKKEAA